MTRELKVFETEVFEEDERARTCVPLAFEPTKPARRRSISFRFALNGRMQSQVDKINRIYHTEQGHAFFGANYLQNMLRLDLRNGSESFGHLQWTRQRHRRGTNKPLAFTAPRQIQKPLLRLKVGQSKKSFLTSHWPLSNCDEFPSAAVGRNAKTARAKAGGTENNGPGF